MNDRWDSNPHDRSLSWAFTKQFYLMDCATRLYIEIQRNSEVICYAVIFILRLHLYANLSIRESLQRLTISATVIISQQFEYYANENILPTHLFYYTKGFDTLPIHIMRQIFAEFFCCHIIFIKNPMCVQRNQKTRPGKTVINSVFVFVLIRLINNNFDFHFKQIIRLLDNLPIV